MTNKADITFIAARLRAAADELDQFGTTAWDTTAAWARGAGIASYDPESGGNRWYEDEDGNVWPIPSDPTGDHALSTEEINRAHSDYVRDLSAALKVADRLIIDVTTATPHKPRLIADADRLAAQVGAEGWCSSCFRNAGKLVSQAMHTNGTARYQGSCRWCREFEQEYGRKPPLSLLQKRHAGRSVTTSDVARALGLVRSTN